MALLGKKPKPQGFNYIPRFYDPEKEDRDARIRAAEAAARGDTEAIKNRIHASFRSPRKVSTSGYQRAKRRSNVTVLVVLIVLLALAWLLLSDFLPQVERMLE